MKRMMILVLGVCLAGSGAMAQTAAGPGPRAAKPAIAAPKAGKGEKVCRHKFPDGTPKAWVCKTDEPCCAWDEIKYVKCGSATFRCL